MQKFVVIGYPVAHSLSPLIHSLFAKQFDLAISYDLLEVKPAQLITAVTDFVSAGGKGANITAPFKEKLYAQLTTASLAAQQAQTINTFTVLTDGSLHGDNTDGVGFVRDITQRYAVNLGQQKILILGAGGAVRGILPTILTQQPQSIMIANRDLVKAHAIAKDYVDLGVIEAVNYKQIIGQKFTLIINATSAASDDNLINLINGLSCVDSICYDLNYGLKSKLFLRYAQSNGAALTIDGLGMLIEQAAEAFYIWHKRRPATDYILAQIQRQFRKIFGEARI